MRTLGSTITLFPFAYSRSSPWTTPESTHNCAHTRSHPCQHPAKFNSHISRLPQPWCHTNLLSVMERDTFSSACELDYSPQQEAWMFLLISRRRLLSSRELQKHSFILFHPVELLHGKEKTLFQRLLPFFLQPLFDHALPRIDACPQAKNTLLLSISPNLH